MVSEASNYSTSPNHSSSHASNKQLPPGPVLLHNKNFSNYNLSSKKLNRLNYLPASYPTVTQISNILDSRLFKKRKHDYQVATQSTYQDKTFITRHLKYISTQNFTINSF
ncbi:hypothetical protein HELRODRAFT_172358 [Helobdella robusta]|uniref:Uncharacterized protein n=1 Tax=Helobdella robusta TaxID=6412 RepID=T1F580_HELRO|nr:hypothetical protein HELRODRAFT_172358 [Helobdella robusta]ESO04688.1 hypothetical protein HELRODRAFT_172358 [Helobdella robusta]